MSGGESYYFKGADQEWALQHACYMANLGLMSDLVREGADVNVTPCRCSPLTSVLANPHKQDNRIEALKLLINAGADINLNNMPRRFLGGDGTLIPGELTAIRSVWGWPALHIACMRDDIHDVSFLVKNGADVNVIIDSKNRANGDLGSMAIGLRGKQFSALYVATIKTSSDIARLLLAAGADVNGSPRDYDPSRNVEIPLYYACEHQNVEFVKLLVKGGANPNAFYDLSEWAENEQNPTTPLGIATIKGNIEIIDILIRAGAEVNGHGQNREEFTPLFYALRSNDIPVIQHLLANGATNPSAEKYYLTCRPLQTANMMPFLQAGWKHHGAVQAFTKFIKSLNSRKLSKAFIDFITCIDHPISRERAMALGRDVNSPSLKVLTIVVIRKHIGNNSGGLSLISHIQQLGGTIPCTLVKMISATEETQILVSLLKESESGATGSG